MHEMDSDDSDYYVPAAAFYVEPLKEGDIDLSVPPSNGIEFLQRVMLETKKCDKVVSVEIERIRQPKRHTALTEERKPESPLAPSTEWQELQAANFSRTRHKIGCVKQKTCPIPRMTVPPLDDDSGWKSLCFGQTACRGQCIGSDGGTPPLLSILSSMGQPDIDELLILHNRWLADCNHMTHLHGQWLYALLACLELPLHPDTCSTIRSIARTCHNIRSSMLEPDTSELAAVNLIICLVGKYFRQNDLAD